MRIYFSAARAYREKYGKNYELIVGVLEKVGVKLTDNGRLNSPSGAFNNLDELQKIALYKTMLKNINRADIVVFEASFPSTMHIGHEITLGMDRGKPVVVLYTVGREPILFHGIENEKVIWVEYNQDNLADKLSKALEMAKCLTDVRFNFFVNPRILFYLDSVSKKRMIPRSVFLRDLIEREMKKDKTWVS